MNSVRANPSAPAERLARAAADLLGMKRVDLAQITARLALAEDEYCASAHSVLAAVLDEREQWADGLRHARRAVELAPNSPQLRYNFALAMLRLGDYRTGFALMEARIDKPDWTGLAVAPSRAAERHRLLRFGDPVDGHRVLVITEQGLGDCIMFARFLPLLAARGARITLVCSPPLRPIFERVSGIDTLLSPPSEEKLAKINLSRAEFDAWVPLLSLPFHLGTELATVPASVPYLTIDPVRIAAWRDRYAMAGRAGMPKVGLVFQANPQSASSKYRSVPIDHLAPLLRLGHLDFVNLQGGVAGRQIAAIYSYSGLIDATPEEAPLDEFAAAVAATDLLITVDTMAAHCAGAVGHPTWAMVPASPYWCWGTVLNETPWYPSTLLFREESRRGWGNVIAAIITALAKLNGTRGSAHDAHRRVTPEVSAD